MHSVSIMISIGVVLLLSSAFKDYQLAKSLQRKRIKVTFWLILLILIELGFGLLMIWAIINGEINGYVS